MREIMVSREDTCDIAKDNPAIEVNAMFIHETIRKRIAEIGLLTLLALAGSGTARADIVRWQLLDVTLSYEGRGYGWFEFDTAPLGSAAGWDLFDWDVSVFVDDTPEQVFPDFRYRPSNSTGSIETPLGSVTISHVYDQGQSARTLFFSPVQSLFAGESPIRLDPISEEWWTEGRLFAYRPISGYLVQVPAQMPEPSSGVLLLAALAGSIAFGLRARR
ncbi:MAG TPA: hypothetical protein PKB08_12330 [Burkholderiaceae bacterium]|nr:hypothetical protein [Burkholderiaceae bacterium]